MSNKKEAIIREKRTIEATKKELMGPNGKLGTIAKYLGHPIIRQGTSLMDVTYLVDDLYDLDYMDKTYEQTLSGQDGPLVDENKIMEADDDFVYEEGFFFDGLSRGIHIEIKYSHPDKKLTAMYKGYNVFTEIAGDLLGYAPFPEWEEKIERLHKAALKSRKAAKERFSEEMAEKIENKKRTWLQELRYRWGI